MIKNLEKRVTYWLKERPETRDNDQKLAACIWTFDIGSAEVCKKMSAWEFLEKFAKNKYTNPDSISRCRQKVQEHNAELRGKKWEKRQNNAKNNVKEEIKNWNPSRQMKINNDIQG